MPKEEMRRPLGSILDRRPIGFPSFLRAIVFEEASSRTGCHRGRYSWDGGSLVKKTPGNGTARRKWCPPEEEILKEDPPQSHKRNGVPRICREGSRGPRTVPLNHIPAVLRLFLLSFAGSGVRLPSSGAHLSREERCQCARHREWWFLLVER